MVTMSYLKLIVISNVKNSDVQNDRKRREYAQNPEMKKAQMYKMIDRQSKEHLQNSEM